MVQQNLCQLSKSIEKLSFDTDGWFPTVEELEAYGIKKNKNNYIHILLYFASDPFTKMGFPLKDNAKYKEMVSYVKNLVKE